MFKLIEGDEIMVVKGGIYYPTTAYEHNGDLYAKVGSGFVRLKANGSTSQPGTRLHVIYREGQLFQDRFGRLCVTPGEFRREIAITNKGELGKVDDPATLTDQSK